MGAMVHGACTIEPARRSSRARNCGRRCRSSLTTSWVQIVSESEFPKLRTLKMQEGLSTRLLNPLLIAAVDKKGAACIAHQASPAYPRFSCRIAQNLRVSDCRIERAEFWADSAQNSGVRIAW